MVHVLHCSVEEWLDLLVEEELIKVIYQVMINNALNPDLMQVREVG